MVTHVKISVSVNLKYLGESTVDVLCVPTLIFAPLVGKGFLSVSIPTATCKKHIIRKSENFEIVNMRKTVSEKSLSPKKHTEGKPMTTMCPLTGAGKPPFGVPPPS